MRRILAALGVLAIGLLPVAGAGAANETPRGRFTSPTRAVAGAPMFVRSIEPCPPAPAPYSWVRVFIVPQVDAVGEAIESTDGDLRADGSWEVTISAPTDMPSGVTKSYSVHAQCIGYEAPYYAPDRDPSVTTTTLPPEFSYFRYFLRPLYVTGFGSSAAAESTTADASVTTTTSVSTTTTQPTPTTLATPTTLSAQSLRSVRSYDPGDERTRAAQARRELARRAMRTHDVALVTSTASSVTPHGAVDGGIPWWSFALATMLAVAAIVGWGAKRSSAPR